MTPLVDLKLPQFPEVGNKNDASTDLYALFNALRNLASQVLQVTGVTIPPSAEQNILGLAYTAGLAKHRAYVPASVPIAYGQLVNFHLSGGVTSARLANATGLTLPAHGICNTVGGVAALETCEVLLPGGLVESVGGLVPGSVYYTSTVAGSMQTPNPSTVGNLIQAIGVAITPTQLYMFSSFQLGVVGGSGGGGGGVGPYAALNGDPSVSFSMLNGTVAGDLALTGAAKRIKADFTNGTIINRALFQTSTVNGNTEIGVIPNGTGVASVLNLHNVVDPDNSSYLRLVANASTDVRILSKKAGTGVFLPMTFFTSDAERMRLDISGRLGLNTTPSPWAAGFTALELGPSASMYQNGANVGFGLAANAYYDGVNWRAKNLGLGSILTFNSLGGNTLYNMASVAAGAAYTLNIVFDIRPSGNVEIANYTKLGTGAPAIKVKKLTGTTHAAEGNGVVVAHGLTRSKILSIDVLVDDGTYLWTSTTFGLKSFSAYVDATYLVIWNNGGTSAGILNMPFTALITYEE